MVRMIFWSGADGANPLGICHVLASNFLLASHFTPAVQIFRCIGRRFILTIPMPFEVAE